MISSHENFILPNIQARLQGDCCPTVEGHSSVHGSHSPKIFEAVVLDALLNPRPRIYSVFKFRSGPVRKVRGRQTS